MESYQVQPITNFLPSLKTDYNQIVKWANQQTGITIEQRLQAVNIEMEKLKIKFRKYRKSEYESKLVELSVAHKCESKASGDVKNCGWRCVKAPVAGLYVTSTRVLGTNKGVQLSATRDTACLKMTVAGKGTNTGTLYAMFKYHPNYVSSIIERELSYLFNMAVSTRNYKDFVDERTGDFELIFDDFEQEEEVEDKELKQIVSSHPFPSESLTAFK